MRKLSSFTQATSTLNWGSPRTTRKRVGCEVQICFANIAAVPPHPKSTASMFKPTAAVYPSVCGFFKPRTRDLCQTESSSRALETVGFHLKRLAVRGCKGASPLTVFSWFVLCHETKNEHPQGRRSVAAPTDRQIKI